MTYSAHSAAALGGEEAEAECGWRSNVAVKSMTPASGQSEFRWNRREESGRMRNAQMERGSGWEFEIGIGVKWDGARADRKASEKGTGVSSPSNNAGV